MCFLKLVSGIGVFIAAAKALFWSYIACAALVQTWANYLQLENGMRIAFFIVSGGVILFFLYGFMEKKHRLSYICTLGTAGIIGGCMAGFWYIEDQQLAVFASLWGAAFFIAIYFFVKKIDHLHRYVVLLFTVCFGVILGSCHYYFSGFVGPIAIGGAMGFIMTVAYFFEDGDEDEDD